MGRGLWKAYCTALTTHALATQAATAAVGFSIGDASAQVQPPSLKSLWRITKGFDPLPPFSVDESVVLLVSACKHVDICTIAHARRGAEGGGGGASSAKALDSSDALRQVVIQPGLQILQILLLNSSSAPNAL